MQLKPSDILNGTDTVERLVEYYGWDVVFEVLLEKVETSPPEELGELRSLIDAAIVLGRARGELIFS